MSCLISGWFFIPRPYLTPPLIDFVKANLSYKSPFADDEGNYKQFLMYKEHEKGIGVPLEWARIHLPDAFYSAVDRRITNEGIEVSKIPDPNHPRVKNPAAQKKLMDDLERAIRNNFNVLMMAATGSGKTVVALWLAAQLNQKTVIMVPTEGIKRQWIREIEDKLGIPKSRIGIAQQKKCQIEGKDIVVAMMPTIANRDETDETFKKLFDWAGYVVCDEGHRLATEQLNAVLPKFKARYKLVMTATPKRKDGSDIVIYNHVGRVAVVGETEIMPAEVFVVPYSSGNVSESCYHMKERSVLFRLSRDPMRNAYLADIVADLYKGGRRIVAISNSVKHIQNLIKLVKARGVDAKDIGQFTATRIEGKKVLKVSDKDQEEALKKQLVFATDGMMKEAIDEPELNSLVELVPFWNGNQRVGRIRRFMAGKPDPTVISPLDTDYEICQRMFESREKDYREAGIKVTRLF